MQKKLDNVRLSNTSSIRNAIQKMDENGLGIVIIEDEEGDILGIVTDGDFRRAVLQGVDLKNSVIEISNSNYKYLDKSVSEFDIRNFFENNNYRHLIVKDSSKLFNLITREEFYHEEGTSYNDEKKLDLPVVIMAGGKGTRLKPFSNILPKPLIPIGDHSVVEEIMNQYKQYGITNFYFTVNFKKNLIKAYFEDIETYNIIFIEEEKFLGTAGSLKYLEGMFKTPFFVSNCDIIVKSDYSEIVDFHLRGKYDLTLVGSMQHFEVPYGVCKIKDGGDLDEISEKPFFDFLVNTGMYLLNPDTLKAIPEGKFFHITNLMEKLKKEGKRVGVFPVSEKSWIDVGQWSELNKYINM